MASMFDAYPPAARSSAADSPSKLRDEINRMSQRLVRARQSYAQDLLSGDPEVPLDEQLSVIESYMARLEVATEQLRQHDAGELPAVDVPDEPLPVRTQAPPPPPPEVQRPQQEVPHAWSPQAPAPARAPSTGPGIANPDGSPLLGDGGTVLRTEDAAVGEYIRHAADQRWLTSNGRSAGGELDAICEVILAALAHKHGVPLEDERQRLARQVDARYRRDYG
jgi:hypothetical protein